MENTEIGVYVGIESDNFSMFVPLERRITFLRGDSGVGKTSFVEFIRFINENGENDSVLLRKPESFSIRLGSTDTLKALIKDSRDSIIIIDDTVQSENVGFTNALMKYVIKHNLYILIINRVDLAFDSTIVSTFDYSVKSILWVEKVEGSGNHNVFPVLSLLDKFSLTRNNVDCIISEDVQGLTDFCMTFNRSPNLIVDSSTPKTKDNIVTVLSKLSGYKNVLLFVDLASFGKNFWDLYSYCIHTESNIILDNNYECFEYMILVSNLFKDKWAMNKSVNDVFSWEKYFEKKLEELSEIVLKHSYHHSRKCTVCLILNCKDCKSYNYCDKKVDGDKLTKLFSDTEFEYLIDLLGGN